MKNRFVISDEVVNGKYKALSSKKEGQYLVFTLCQIEPKQLFEKDIKVSQRTYRMRSGYEGGIIDNTEGIEVEDVFDIKYDLATGKFYGKSGKEVKNINIYLKNFSLPNIINSFGNENYSNFLAYLNKYYINRCTNPSSWNYHNRPTERIRNMGTFLDRVRTYKGVLEQYFAVGFKEEDIKGGLTVPINELPKGLLKLCREQKLEINDQVINSYKRNPDFAHNIFGLETYAVQPWEKKEIVNYSFLLDNTDEEIFKTHRYRANYDSAWAVDFFILVGTYNYNPVALLKYADNLVNYEGMDSTKQVITELLDYCRMITKLSKKAKFEKYPRYFLTTHAITVKNFNRLKEEFDKEEFEKIREKNKKRLEFKCGDYAVYYPKDAEAIKDEAIQQNNCVASYIKRVLDGTCFIVFLRKKEEPEKSLITVEVRGDKVVQYEGKYRRGLNLEEQVVMDKYKEILVKRTQKLKVGGNLEELEEIE